MYRKSLSLFSKLLGFILIPVVLITAFNVVETKSLTTTSTALGTVVVWAILAYIAHFKILLPKEPFEKKLMMGFVLRATALGLVVLLPGTVLSILLIILYKPASVSSEAAIVSAIPLALLTLLVTTLLLVPLVGTILPAYVLQLNKGVLLAVRRGKPQYWRLVKLILIGPSFVYLISIVLPFLGAMWFPAPAVSADWSVNISALPFFLGSNIFSALAIIMMSWILCDAYTRGENIHHPTTTVPA